jgi:predicted RNase H-like HicB family nuclease
MTTTKASELLKKPYTRIMIPDEESGTFTAQIVEFPGCIAQGDTPAEAYERLESTAESWIEAALAMHQEIPPPSADAQFSGRFALRLPRSLHRQVAQLAELDGTSLNQFIVSTLAEKVGAVSMYRGLTQQLSISIARNTTPSTNPAGLHHLPATTPRPDARSAPQSELIHKATARPLRQDN